MKNQPEVNGLALLKLEFNVFPSDNATETDLNVKINTSTDEIGNSVISLIWDISLELESIFKVRAEYDMLVSKGKNHINDLERLTYEVSYPVLAEFSMLVGTLTKSMGMIPLVLDTNELSELGGLLDTSRK
ncbi:MAG: hypothetical protein GX331_08055 [Firmicutes bacterium]|jgi:hypothetical protein|nr:hypothetical protein [Bacillota bacterium]